MSYTENKFTITLSDDWTRNQTNLKKDIQTFRKMVDVLNFHPFYDPIEDHFATLRMFHYLLAIDVALQGGESC